MADASICERESSNEFYFVLLKTISEQQLKYRAAYSIVADMAVRVWQTRWLCRKPLGYVCHEGYG